MICPPPCSVPGSVVTLVTVPVPPLSCTFCILQPLLDSIRPPTSIIDRRSPDERYSMGPFPSKLEDIKLGWRLDALDVQGGWYAATVVEVRELS